MVSSAALPSVNTEAPEQGSAQVEVMKGTGGDKMCREEGGRGREPPAQTNALTRKPQQEKRQENEQWQQESGAQRGSAAASPWEAFKDSTSLLLVQVSKLTAEQKQINLPKLSIQVVGYPDFHQSRNNL